MNLLFIQINLRRITYVLSLIIFLDIFGCSQNVGKNIGIFPTNFKTAIPYQVNNRGIIIDAYLGDDKVKRGLLWDNHSPTWLNNISIQDNKSFSKSNDFLYKTTTADGAQLRGEVYLCNRVILGDVTFKNVPLYKIPDEQAGVLGENIISKGIWKIEFTKKLITFVSSIDSLEDLNQSEIFPAIFTESAIMIEITFRNKIVKDAQLDFGFNGEIIMPANDFRQITDSNKRLYKQLLKFSTPGRSNVIENIDAVDTIYVKKRGYWTIISTNESDREILIGLSFFARFEFVILDYINKRIYVSKKRSY